MKIFFVTNIPLEVYSAPRTHVLELYNNLSNKNEVILFVMNANDDDIRKIKYIYHFNIFFKNWSKLSFRFGLLFHSFLLIIIIVYRILKSGKPDMAYVRHYPTLAFEVLLFKLLNIPVITDVKGIVLKEISLYRKINWLENSIIKA